MLNTCANPNCSESFRYLRDGQLFRLQAEVKGSSSEISNPEYFWLCPRCSETMSLRLAEDRRVIAVLALKAPCPEITQSDFMPLERRGGLLLSCLQSLRPSVARAMPVPRRRAAYAS